MFQSTLLVVLLWFPLASLSLDYYFLNGYSNPMPDDITSLALTRNATIFVSAYGPQFFVYQNDTPNSYLKRLQTPAAGTINSIDITGDGQDIALGLNNYQIKLYKYNEILNTIVLNQTISDATDQINSVSFSYDKSLLIAGSKDSKARLYVLLNGQYALSRIISQSAAITSVLISPKNIYLYVADAVGTLRIYKNSTVGYSLFQTISDSTVALNSISLSNNSLYLSVGDFDGQVRVYKLNEFSNVSVSYVFQQTLTDATVEIKSVSTNSDGSILITSDNLKTIRIYSQVISGYYSLKYSNLTGLMTKISSNSSIILGSNDKVTNVYKTCGIIANCYQCSSATFCTVCNTGFYSNSGGVCETCSSNCSSCVTLPTTCIGCIEGYFVGVGSVCQQCALGCRDCTSAVTCILCYDGYYKLGATCLACQTNCSTCTNGVACTSCATTHYQSAGFCLPCIAPCNRCSNVSYCTGCIANFYLSSPTNCTPCQPPCITCNSLTACTSCMSGYFYTGVNCQLCPRHCATCTSQLVCTSCNASYPNAYFNGTHCNICPYNCSSCTSATNCLTCADGFYSNAGSCPKCASHCTTCSSATVCTNCSSQYLLSAGNCIRCPDNCTNCNTPTQCTSCKKGFFLQSSQCRICNMTGCIYCSSSSVCTLCEGGYGLVNDICVSFQSSTDPYGYVREITLTRNQTLSLVLTIILLMVIMSGGVAVYCWIMKELEDPNNQKDEITPTENREKNQNQTVEASQMHLNNSLNLP